MEDKNDNSKLAAETEAYLARVKKTVAASKALIQQAELRIAETDRLLEEQGLTREQVMSMHFSEAQFEAINAELKRRGMDPLEKWSEDVESPQPAAQTFNPSEFQTSSDAELSNRRQKFGMMMKPFQL